VLVVVKEEKKRRKIKERKLKVKETLITKEDVWQKGGGHVKGCKWTFIDNLCGCEGIHITKEEAKERGKKKRKGERGLYRVRNRSFKITFFMRMRFFASLKGGGIKTSLMTTLGGKSTIFPIVVWKNKTAQ
jgi:hypothetical protein